MKTRMRRILSLALVICLCLTMLPAVAMQAEAASNIVINGVDIGYANESYFTKNGSTCKDYNNYHSNGTAKATCHRRTGYDCTRTTDPSCNCMRYWPTGSPSNYQVDLGASQCFGFARYCQWRVYGYHDGNSSGKFTDLTGRVSADGCTASYLKSKLINCAPATHLRTGDGGHSIAIVSATDYGVNLADCNSDGCCTVHAWTYSWAELATYLQGRSGLSYANSAKAGAGSGHSTHTYTGSYYEAAHPHKVYQMCSCGATRYTGGTTTVSTCDSCNPVTSSSKYNSVLPFKAYLKGTSKVYPYTTAQLATQSGGEIWSTDECTITAVYSNGACKVSYPVGSTTKTAYTSLSNFVGNTSASLTKQTVNHQVRTYIRDSTGSTVYGYIGAGDVIYKLGTSGSMTQVFYPSFSGYKLAWVQTYELVETTYDTRFNPYCPIKGYPCATATFNAYASDYTTDIGDIWTSDYCTINAIYADGWCQVTYPVGSSTKTGYTKLSNFVYNTSASHIKYTAKAQTPTYTNQSLSTDNGWLSAGDVFYVVGTYGSASQVLYPIDAQYGGGYKLGWIYTSALPKTTYTVSFNANGGSGAPSNQTKTHGAALTLSTTVPTRTGYAFVGWATSSSATSATYAPGASYTTDANLTLYAVWTLNKYEITYNANGGTNAPATQNKAHGTNLTLSTGVPTKAYTVTFNANGGTVDVVSRQVACKFLGWATSSSATSATYQPGSTFTTNANTTLYAVWQNPTVAQYSIPVRAGYVFDSWYTSASGGTQVTLSTVVSSNITVYAHWVVATYGVNYDANGGTNAPAEQIKTHGKNLTLSATVPTRENYTFLGWATEENPDEVQYQPGDTYAEDCGIMLIAVWQCDLNPVITVGSVSGKPGDTVTVPVQILDNPGIIAARLKIAYNSDSLTLIKVTDGGILGQYKFGDTLTANPYIVSWSNGTAETDYTTIGDLVYLTFKIAPNAPAGYLPITVSYDAEEIYNKDLTNVAFELKQGAVTVWKIDCEGAHSYSYAVTSKPTTNTTGMLTGTCSKCSDTTTVTLPKLSTTDYSYKVTKEPTYSTTGSASYTWKTTTYGIYSFDVILAQREPDVMFIEIEEEPIKTRYEVGESLDTTGLLLRITYNNFSTEIVDSGYTISGFNSGSIGTSIVTVSYGGASASFPVSIVKAKFDLAGSNMELGNSLTMYLYVNQSDVAEGDYYMEIVKTYADGRANTVKTVPMNKWGMFGTMYRVGFSGVAAKEMTDDFYVTVYHADGTQASNTRVISVADYAISMLNSTDASHAASHNLMADMLNYGAAAQQSFKYAQNKLANANMTAAHKACGTQNFSMDQFSNNTVKGTGFMGGNLTLVSNICMNVYFDQNIVDNTMTARVSYTDHNGKKVSYEIPGSEFFVLGGYGFYGVEITTMAAADAESVVTVEILDGSTVVASGSTSVESVAVNGYTGVPLYVDLMKFCTAAYNFFH